jgi:hypothetical protein
MDYESIVEVHEVEDGVGGIGEEEDENLSQGNQAP